MNDIVVANRGDVIGLLSSKAPMLRDYFENVLPAPTYTVPELNTIFRYEIIRFSPNGLDTSGLREWLFNYPTIGDWLRYFIANVLPFFKATIAPTKRSYVG